MVISLSFSYSQRWDRRIVGLTRGVLSYASGLAGQLLWQAWRYLWQWHDGNILLQPRSARLLHVDGFMDVGFSSLLCFGSFFFPSFSLNKGRSYHGGCHARILFRAWSGNELEDLCYFCAFSWCAFLLIYIKLLYSFSYSMHGHTGICCSDTWDIHIGPHSIPARYRLKLSHIHTAK